MNKKIFNNARVCPKGDTEANWNKAVGFVPLDKEIIIYKADDTHNAARFKVGDGKTVVQDLPFSGTDIEDIEKLIDEKGELLIEYVDNAVAAIDIPEVDQVYNSESVNAQSGVAIDSALKPIEQKNDEQDTKIAAIESKVIAATKDSILSIFN
jgi:hypothetical protein